MRAWKIVEPGVTQCEDMDSQSVGENCVKIKILQSAVSAPDKTLFNGRSSAKYPIIPGRICVGVVSEVGESVKKLQRGNKVLAVPKISCHECSVCQAGKSYDCKRTNTFGVNEDGFLRDFAVVNANDLYLLPDRVNSDEALYIDYINLAISAILQLNLEKGSHISIIGATDIGIIIAQVALYHQMVPILVDTNQSRLDIATALGVYYTINSVDSVPYKKILNITGGKMVDGLIYLVSSDLPLQKCFDYVRKEGSCALVGDEITDKQLSGDFAVLVNRGLDVTGITGELRNVSGAINMLANRSVNVLPIMGKIASFEDIGGLFSSDVFDELKDGKIIIRM